MRMVAVFGTVALLLAPVPTWAGDIRYTYDQNGNMVTRTVNGVTTEFVFDARDLLVEVRQAPHILARFQYDGRGRLILKIGLEGVRQYVHDGDSSRVLAELDEAGNPAARYTWAGSQLNSIEFPSLGVFYPVFDGLGSVVGLTDQAGNVVARYHYDAWGNLRFPEELQANPNRYLFTGHRWQPEIGLYNANARYMDPQTGRFTSADPHPSTINDPATLHRYVYARNAPTRYTDPLGLWDWDKVLGGKATDAELRQESSASKDKARRKEIGQVLNQREAFRYGLQEAARARDALPEGGDRARVDRALAAYGNEGDAPLEDVVKTESGQVRFVRRVIVGSGETSEPRVPATTSGRMDASFDEQRAQLNYEMESRVTFRPEALTKDSSLGQYVAHEGSHAADYQRLQAAVVTETRTGVALQPALGDPSIDLTKYETEKEAYRVSASVAEGQYAQNRSGPAASASGTVVFKAGGGPQSKLVVRAGKSDHTLWDATWRDDQRAANRDAAIDQYLAVGRPQGIYGVTPQSPGSTLSGTPIRKEPEP